MLAAMVHRGPDDSGVFADGDFAMGMRRLAIFDPANGHQPMSTPDGRWTLIFNGAIYNFHELRQELEASGVQFHTDCDTEVLLQSWVRWGRRVLPRLRGMFAFAMWETETRRLTLARDVFGIKPLYFSQRGSDLIFASELNAMRASQHFDAEIDPEGIDAFLRNLGVPAPRTIYRHAKCLRPAEVAEWHDGRWSIERYWQLPAASEIVPIAAEDFRTELRERLEDTIANHRLADVPVGAFLSGGLDSAAVVGLMARASSAPIKTFSIGFPETEYSEAAAAAETARHFGTDHHAIELTGENAAASLPDFIAALDQPTGDGLNTFTVSRAARAGGVTVALSGLGGDELFGGYNSFRQTPALARSLPLWRLTPAPLRNALCLRLERGNTRSRRLADVLKNSRDIHDVADRQRQVLSDSARGLLLSGYANNTAFHPHPAQRLLREILAGASPEAVVSAWELNTYMPDVLLRDSDVFSMRASLELRVPFVDVPLIDWLWRQPTALRIAPGQTKKALVDSVTDILPPDLLNRRKQGFTLPFVNWMRGPLRPFLEDTFSTRSIQNCGWLNPSATESYWTRFLQAGDDKDWSRVWSLAVLIAFLNRPASR